MNLTVNGEEVVQFEEIANAAISFYDSLYKKDEMMRPHIENFFDNRLSEHQVHELEKPFTEEEVKDDIFGMDGSKAPSLDCLSMSFYQECWETIKTDLMRMFDEFFHRGEMCKSMRSTFIALVPKKEDARGLGDYRPINLVSSLHKVISKVLAIRLRGINQGIMG